MSEQMDPIPVLEYQPPATTWAPVVNICAWIGLGIGAAHVVALVGLIMFRLFALQSASMPLGYTAALTASGISGAGAIVGGVGCLRLVGWGRRLMVICCAALAMSAAVGLALHMFELRAILRQSLGPFGIVGNMLMSLAIFGPWFFAPATLLLLLRRPEARRVFEAAR